MSKDETVTALKDAIKARRSNLKDMAADYLILYKVSIPISSFISQLAEQATLELEEPKALFGGDELSEVFANGLLRKHVHVVVQIPSGAWVCVGLPSLR
jgi:hypothetical protein